MHFLGCGQGVYCWERRSFCLAGKGYHEALPVSSAPPACLGLTQGVHHGQHDSMLQAGDTNMPVPGSRHSGA